MMRFFRSGGVESIAEQSAPVGRRGLVVGAGVAGVAAVAAAVLTRRGAEALPVSKPKPARVAGEGYRETEHVLRYYDSTRS